MPIHHWEEIAALCRRIVQEFQPKKVVLFGSYAYGTPTPSSDVDLLVVMPYQGSSGRASADILQRTQPGFGVDVLVRTPAEVEERLVMDDYFMREVIERGQVLYEANHARVGR
jgi:predicted nucleotidyltransferase